MSRQKTCSHTVTILHHTQPFLQACQAFLHQFFKKWIRSLLCILMASIIVVPYVQATEVSDLTVEGFSKWRDGDYDEGTQDLMEAASDGDQLATYALAFAYINGWGVEEDEERANDMLQQLADDGFVPAMGYVCLSLIDQFDSSEYETTTRPLRPCQKAYKAGSTMAKLVFSVLKGKEAYNYIYQTELPDACAQGDPLACGFMEDPEKANLFFTKIDQFFFFEKLLKHLTGHY